MSELNFQQLSTVQSAAQEKPVTIASAATVAPVNFLTVVTGVVAIATITPPITGAHMLVFVHTDVTPTAYTTTGNILNAATPTVDLPTFLVYNPVSKKYYAAATNLT